MVRYDYLLEQIRIPPKYSLFLTVTLPKRLNSEFTGYQFNVTYPCIVSILNRYCYDFCLVTEVTEDANVHYHAWIILKKQSDKCFLCAAIKKDKNLGFYKLDKNAIEDQHRVYKYMRGECDKDKEGKDLKAAHKIMPLETRLVTNFTSMMFNENKQTEVQSLNVGITNNTEMTQAMYDF